jgi:hypothetical protein
MKEKNLPIKIFEKRKIIDDRRIEGGGDNELPKWANLSESELSRLVAEFTEVLGEVTEKLNTRPKERDFIPAVLEVEMNSHAIAKSHRGDIASLFNSGNESNFIGYIDERTLLVKVNSSTEVNKINHKLNQKEKNKKGIASISEIKKFEPRVSIEKPTKKEPLKVTLLNFNDYQLNQSIANLFEITCKRNQVQFKKVNYTPDLIIYRVSNVSMDAFEAIKEFDAVEKITVMPTYSVTTDSFTETKINIKIKKPLPGKSYPIIGVLDTGIKDIPHLKPWLLPDKFIKIPPSRIDYRHGTFVAGILVYCDELEGNVHVGNNGCYLFDATVHPGDNDTIEEYELVENIREAIEKNYKVIKIWNLALGTRIESSTTDFSDFGKALDYIQERFGVLICKSVGNCTNFLYKKPVSRVANSADSIRSLVIGSVAHKKGSYDLADVNHRSPFSRIGKAPSYINKPDLTQIGGNAGIDENGQLAITGVNSFDINGNIVQMAGTSFSTPRVTALEAEIDNRIDEEFNPLLLKALAIHSAKYPLHLNIPNSEKLRSLGYGIPSIVEDILFNDPFEITLILQDTLTKGNWVQIWDLPFPQEMTDSGHYYGEIIATLISAPVLIDKQGAEYCQSDLKLRIGTYEKIKKRQGPTILNEWGLNENQNILDSSLYPSRLRQNHIGDFARERTLIKYGDKYQPVKKYAVNLDEVTPANKRHYLTPPKKWYLEIEPLYRMECIDQYARDGVELSQEFCMVVTIRDNKRKHRIYDLATKLLNDNGFIHSDINLKGRVRITTPGR